MSYQENWNEEKQSAVLYRLVAAKEHDEEKSKMFIALARAAEEQACIWEKKIRVEGGTVPGENKLTIRTRIVSWLIKVLGPRAIRPVLAAMKVRGLSVYSAGMLGEGHAMPTSVEEVGHRHAGFGGGGNLRAAVFGISDGLVSNASLVMGVAGATHNPKMILMTGIAGMVAGAASMAAGEYVSVRSQRELYEYQIRLEREELEQYPEEEAEELALIYNARGVEMGRARRVATDLLKDPEHALDTLAREELGLNPDDLGSPVSAASFSFFSFSLGAVIPLLPFLYGSAAYPVVYTALVTLISLYGVGALLSLFTGRSAAKSGVRMMLIGGSAGIVTYAIGTALGVSLL